VTDESILTPEQITARLVEFGDELEKVVKALVEMLDPVIRAIKAMMRATKALVRGLLPYVLLARNEWMRDCSERFDDFWGRRDTDWASAHKKWHRRKR
jgi:hypothetical protein